VLGERAVVVDLRKAEDSDDVADVGAAAPEDHRGEAGGDDQARDDPQGTVAQVAAHGGERLTVDDGRQKRPRQQVTREDEEDVDAGLEVADDSRPDVVQGAGRQRGGGPELGRLQRGVVGVEAKDAQRAQGAQRIAGDEQGPLCAPAARAVRGRRCRRRHELLVAHGHRL